jgi:3-oxoacyl-[acyl-carrier-protein] synthase II
MTDGRRVAVTGVGLVSPLGVGTQANWEAILSGKSGIGPITRFDASLYSARIAGEVQGFDPLQFVDKKDVKKMDVFIQFALAASQFAVDDARLEVTPGIADSVGVFIASGIGGFQTIEREHVELMKGGPRRISPFFIPASIINLAAGQVSIRFNARGPNLATCTACTASAHAIGEAYEIIRRGDADIMIAGGSEAAITPMGVGGFAAMRALSTRNDDPQHASRPFDRDRDGFVMGEGAGICILETLDSARRRGAPVYAELVGYGLTSDAYHLTGQPEEAHGAVRSMAMALRKAGVEMTAVVYINAHGTSTPINDPTETRGVKTLFGEHAYKLAMSSTKSMTGHLLGAAGGLEAGITALAIKHQIAPPTINLDNPDPACDLDYVPHKARPMKIRYALSNSFGFGGTNGTLLMKQFEELIGPRDRSGASDEARASEGSSSEGPEGTGAKRRPRAPTHENRRLHQAGRDARVAAARERPEDLDPRPGRQLRAERTGRLRARRGLAAEGEARRGSHRLFGGSGPGGSGHSRGPRPRGRSRRSCRGGCARNRGRERGGGRPRGRDRGGTRRPRPHGLAVRRPGFRTGRSGAGREARHAARHHHHGGRGRRRCVAREA